MSITIPTLLHTQQLPGFTKPHAVHVGFMKPRDIAAVSDVPHFTRSTHNSQLANNLTIQPVKEWQRFPDPDRISKIHAIFSSHNEIMPNAVLLCENLNAIPQGQVNAIPFGFQDVPALWKVTLPTGTDSPNRPLWVIDGQHRIAGLAQALPDTPIPVVLLLNHKQVYAPNQVARIFAQVTTGAEPLAKEHGEWMAYAFSLGQYASPSQGPGRRQAMATVVELCRNPSLPDGTANPFFNQIQFNPDSQNAPNPQFGNSVTGGFNYRCQDLQKLLFDHYFVNTTPPMSPQDVASVVGMAVKALSNVIGTPMDTVFFGDGARDVIVDAFLIGVLAYLHKHNPCALQSVHDWENLLRSLQFAPPADWVFHWALSYNGRAAGYSRDIAADVFASIFMQLVPALPAGVTDIPSFLQGAQAQAKITLATLTPTGRGSTSPKNQSVTALTRGFVGTLDANAGGTNKYFARIEADALNVADIEVMDDQARGNARYLTDDFKRGVNLTTYGSAGRLKLSVVMHLFGGLRCEAGPIDLKWQ